MDKNTKTLLSVGSLLIILGVVPHLFWVGIVGMVLFLIGIQQFSRSVQDHNLFSDTLWAFLIPVIGLTILSFVIIGTFATTFSGAIIRGEGIPMRGFPGRFSSPFAFFSAGGGLMFLGGIITALIAWTFAIVYGIRMQKVSLSLENYLHNNLFRTAGSLFFWGGWLSIILVGMILIWVGWLLYTIGFFSVSEKGV
ncbi:DUF996 domain-containing protein [Thermospira aquatica]|uniref:DUF996 domain-containing protein n=1 Tax=Thermospira aquatica TaxID=2828656 RepID=A0AAX3BIG4_9SPIR|nr:DUF996 domain-containing protein [Thermospira aquatica]URA11161.1 DUF996 domain-containing protein [Thermospira aquatica]